MSTFVSIVERSCNYAFGDVNYLVANSPRTRDVNKVICSLFTNSIYYWERYACLTFTFQNGKGHSGEFFREGWGEWGTKQNMLWVNRIWKGCNSGMIEYINLKLSGNVKGRWSIDQKGNKYTLLLLLQLLPLLLLPLLLLLLKSLTTFKILRGNWN